jgi:hypothetical protein
MLKKMPIGLKHLLCEITDAEVGAQIREEILQDEGARHVSLVSTYREAVPNSPRLQTFFVVSVERKFLFLSKCDTQTPPREPEGHSGGC